MSRNATGQMPNNGSFGGDEFSNNLLSDLAPLLTLFGEQVTKQFLSMSMGWADDILLAMGPLGIMTVIVSTIRVGRVRMLKAFVGRARESRANAEKEILSSTSEDVCELWTGREVVRELGHPEGMKDLILLEKPIMMDTNSRRRIQRKSDYVQNAESTQVLDITSAYHNKVLTSKDMDDEQLISISSGAPNIALNIRNSTASPRELIAFAIVGTVLQIGGLIFPAITTYFLKWGKGGSAIASYGYPCFAAGTMAVILGMIFCGRVIEGSTTEHEFNLSRQSQRGDLGRVQIMRLQKACTVSDQHFPSYAIFNSPQDIRIRTSRLNNIDHRRMATFGTLTAVVGFVAQFVGLRALHWSATIFQLGVMLIMTTIRSWVRRGLAADPEFYELLDGHELSWVVLYILCNDEKGRSEEKDISLKNSVNESDTRFEHSRNFTDTTERVPQTQLTQVPESYESHTVGTSTSKQRLMGWVFKKSFPYVIWNKRSQEALKFQPFDKMLDSIVRWEPLTGHRDIPEWRWLDSEAIKVEKSRFTRVFDALPPRKHDADDGENVQSHTRPLEIFRDLQQLAPIMGEAVDDANSVALAMERTMAFLEKSDHVLWHDKGGPFMHHEENPQKPHSFKFYVDVIVGSYRLESTSEMQQLELQLTGKLPNHGTDSDANERRNHVWTADRESFAAFISMWLFALELRRSVATQLMTATRLVESWYLVEMGYLPEIVNSRNAYLRILGSDYFIGHEPERMNFAALRHWIPGRIMTIDPMDLSTISEDVPRGRSIGPAELENLWVTWGAKNAGMFATQVPHTSGESASSLHDIVIQTRSDTRISQHCALDLFGYFMDAVAAKIQKLGGRTRPILSGQSEDISIESWSNSVLESIANECVMAGLAHDIAEAYTVIVPAFMKHDLLPTEPHDVLEFTRNDAKPDVDIQ